MAWLKHDYDDIPGTYVFNGRNAHRAFGLNKLLFSFNHEHNRQAFADDPGAYADRFALTEGQRKALLGGDYLGLLRQGANIYYVAKLAVPNGVSIQDAGAAFQGITTEQFKNELLARGECVPERLDEEGGFWHG